MRKRYKVWMVCVLLLLSFGMCAACGKSDSDDEESTKDSTTTESVSESEETTETTAEAQVDADGFTIVNDTVTTTDIVNVRTTPSTDGEAAMKLSNGVEVTRIGYNDEWSKVTIDGQTYYIYSEYLQVNETTLDQTDSDGTDGQVSGTGTGKTICIDAGHQATANTEEEPIGPGAEEKKAKVSEGTTGVTTGTKEYELNLAVALKLKDVLTARGYTVVMIRETNDVDISNAARAEIANGENADAFIRIHANGSTDSSANGILTICQTKDNPYNGDIYTECRQLAASVLSGLAASTGATSEGVWETDSMSGINWSDVPVTIVEIGYLTNSEEDQKLATDDYQSLVATGIADGLDSYFAGSTTEETASEETASEE